MSTQNLAQFEFVPVEINGTGQVKNRQVQRKIRKHVMKDIGRARRRDTTAESTELIIHGPARVTATLGSGQSDPFASYPVKMTLRMHELVNHMFANMSCFRAVMLPLGGSSETGFHQVIANSALHATLIRTSKEQETVDSIHHHAIAIKSVNRALLNAAESTSNTVIAAILQITWYDHFIGNTESWNMHMNGLRTIIDLRGGIEQLNQYRTLRLVTFWMDILGSLTQDIIPRFSLPPSTFLPDLKSFSSAKTQSRTQLFPLESINALHPNLNDVVAALKDLRSFTFMLQFELTRNPAKWQDNTVSSHYVDPIVHRLLSVRSKCHKLTQEFAIHEICRIGGLLYTSGIRRKFMIYPVHSGTLIQRLQDLLLSSETDIVPVQPILLWTLALAITETKDDEKRHFFIERLVSHLVAQGIASWNGVMAVLQSIMWMEDVFDAGLGGIEAPFRSIMHAQGG